VHTLLETGNSTLPKRKPASSLKTTKPTSGKKCTKRGYEGDEEKEEEGEAAAREQDISTKIRTNEQALHCIRVVMQFAIDSNSCSFLELYCIQLRTAFKKTLTQKSGNKFLCWICGRNLNELYIRYV
jgi:hypothetical protein